MVNSIESFLKPNNNQPVSNEVFLEKYDFIFWKATFLKIFKIS